MFSEDKSAEPMYLAQSKSPILKRYEMNERGFASDSLTGFHLFSRQGDKGSMLIASKLDVSRMIYEYPTQKPVMPNVINLCHQP